MHLLSPNSSGFSLLEVLVALAILAISLGALSKSYQIATQQSLHLRDKTLAQWVALNQLSRLRLQNSRPTAGKIQGHNKMGYKTWYWQAQITATDFTIKRIHIQVYPSKDKAYVIAALDGFI